MLEDIVLWSPPPVQEPAFYREPEDAWVSRRPVIGSRSHAAGFSIDHRDNLIKPTESQIEHGTLTIFISDNLASVECQPAPIQYTDHLGAVKEHTFDFRVTLHCGRRIAIYVKPSRRVRIKRLKAFVQLLADEMPDGFADEVCLITERDLPRWVISNAQLICSALLDPIQEVDQQLAAAAQLAQAPLTIADLSRGFGGPGKITRPVARLIHRQVFIQIAPGLISPDTVIAHHSIDRGGLN